ncbi:MAG: DUF882 domain-containing protein [Pseudomonadota bacterium]
MFQGPSKVMADGVRKVCLSSLAAAFAFALLSVSAPATAQAETRTLKLYFTHTKERAEITFKKNGRYVQSGLNKLNRFLRDHRRNEPTKMDPKLFDLIWEAYRMTRSREYIHVVSAYRSPQTNAMLRRTRGGQASKSQHMVGKAIDFYIPGVSAKKLREIGFKLQGGGVGYYPRSGTPYVHFDTAGVRAWPRMSRAELTRLFPNGRTLHLPPDGKPLPGYQQALAEYKRRQARGQVAAVVDDTQERSGGLFSRRRNNQNNERPEAQPTPAASPTPTVVAQLPASRLPTPEIAPRVSTGVPVNIAPVVPAPTVVETVEQQPQTVFAYAPPIPRRRPEVLVAAAPAPTERRTARDIEIALSQPATEETGESTPTNVNAVLQALDADRPTAPTTESAPKLAYANLPNPSARPRLTDEILPAPPIAQPELQIASAPVLGDRGDRIGLPTERPVIIDEATAAEIRAAALDSGVPTTRKLAKPTQLDAIEVAAVAPSAVQISPDINPERFGSWTTSAEPLAENAAPTQKPNFLQNAMREAPAIVYTQGFTKAPTPDANRFSGNAVTFLAVAKFDGGLGGGDGQPLQLQVPATN